MAKKKPKPETTFRFDAKNKRAALIARLVGSKLITSITDETREAIRVLIARAIREGMHPYEAARMIVGVITEAGATTNEAPGLLGLNTQQVHAALNYRTGLIDMGHTPAAVERLMGKYVRRKLRERGEMIARTETMYALNTGAETAYRQAKAQGYLGDGSKLMVVVTHDERLCKICAPLDGRTKNIGEADFPNSPPGPPFHPNCRCTVVLWSGHAL